MHGAPLGEEETALTRKALGWEYGPFQVPQEAYDHYRKAIEKGKQRLKEGMQIVEKEYQRLVDLSGRKEKVIIRNAKTKSGIVRITEDEDIKKKDKQDV